MESCLSRSASGQAMSTSRETTIWCDFIGVGNQQCVQWHQGCGNAGLVRADAKRIGWSRLGGRDMCPMHRKGKEK